MISSIPVTEMTEISLKAVQLVSLLTLIVTMTVTLRTYYNYGLLNADFLLYLCPSYYRLGCFMLSFEISEGFTFYFYVKLEYDIFGEGFSNSTNQT